jgi:hypothetical protein
MYTRWLYSNINNPTKNIEVRRCKCGRYYARGFITSPRGQYVLGVLSFSRINKSNLIEVLEFYILLSSEVINENK